MTELLLPEGTRLLHIGPHKTGTTSLQGALSQARPDLPTLGVVYPGSKRQHALAARAVTGNPGPRGDAAPTARDWKGLVREVKAAGDKRVIISSESFANATVGDAQKTVDGLGGDRVHVLVTLRPLSKVMPSAWQQYVREGLKASYERWLIGMLREAPFDQPTPTFWKRHSHDTLIERWASVVGPERLTVVVLDGSDRNLLPHAVEGLVGLPEGTLKAAGETSNRSLTYSEIELVRAVSQEFARRGWSAELFRVYVRNGLIDYLQSAHQPQPTEVQIPTPAWALERAGEIGAKAAAAIAGSGVRIIGDLSVLGEVPSSAGDDVLAVPPTMTIDAAAAAVIGTITGGNTLNQRGGVVGDLTNRELAAVLKDRMKEKFGRTPPDPG